MLSDYDIVFQSTNILSHLNTFLDSISSLLKRVQFWSLTYPIFSSVSKYASRTPCIHRINIQIYTHTDKTINITRNKPIKGIPIRLSNSIATSGIEEIEHPFCFQVYDGLKNSNEPLTLYQPYLTLDSCFLNTFVCWETI